MTDAEVILAYRVAEECGFDVALLPVRDALLVTVGDPGNPSGVGLGRLITQDDGTVVAHCENFIVRPAWRGVRSLAILNALHGKWVDVARAMGASHLTAGIERQRGEVIALVRRYKYAAYAMDADVIWYGRAA